jgi:hypothetical protein
MQSKFKSRQGSMKVNTVRKAMMAIGGITALVFIISLAAPKTTHAVIATFVQVVNAPSQPVPVANGTDANGVLPLQNRNIDNGPRNAIQLTAAMFIAAGAENGGGLLQASGGTNFQVPIGKRLVIEHVSGEIALASSDSVVNVRVITFRPGSENPNYLVPSPPLGSDSSGLKHFAFSQAIRAYSDQGGFVIWNFSRSNTSTDAFGQMTIQGYLVDCTGACPLQ